MYTMKECDTNNKHEPLVQGPSVYYFKEILEVIEDVNYPPPIEAGACEEQAIVD